jgi:hypothetical protein
MSFAYDFFNPDDEENDFNDEYGTTKGDDN